jgi:glucosyl-dolichyl phosphate glucuronosyltransferase
VARGYSAAAFEDHRIVTISVVIATRNRACLLHSTLERLRHQQYESDDEVIVVDNASTDATADVIARAADGFPVRLHRMVEPMPGKTPALNAGLAAARGKILALTDDDVLVGEHWIRTIRNAFARSTLALVGGRVDPRWEAAPPRWLRVEGEDCYERMASPLALLHYGAAQELGARTVVGANMAFRRTVLQKLGGFDTDYNRRSGTLLSGEDHDFCERAVAAGFRCEYLPELRVEHWVPAERLRLQYYVRWFYCSGITHAMLDRRPQAVARASSRVSVRHYIRRLLMATVSAPWLAMRGELARAAVAAMDGTFAAGYLSDQIRPASVGGRRGTHGVRGTPANAPAGRRDAPLGQSERKEMGNAG